MALKWSPLLHASDRPEDQLLLDLYFSVKGGGGGGSRIK